MKVKEYLPLDMVDDKSQILHSVFAYGVGTLIMIGSIFPVLSLSNLLNIYLNIYRTDNFYQASSNNLIMIGSIFVTGIIWICGFFILQGKIEKHIYSNKIKVVTIFVISILVEAVIFLGAFLLTGWIRG